MHYLSVKNLAKYQHYKHRNPPWIKLYREVWTDYTLRQLPIVCRLLFLGLSSLAMELENKVPADPKYLSDRLGFKITQPDISNLILSNLILSNLEEQIASAVLAECKQNASASDKPLMNGRNYREEAKALLDFLNEKTGKGFRVNDTNMEFIMARLRSGVDSQTCRTLIMRKVRDWLPDPKMSMYLRPETLFNKTKFETYLAEVTS
jgi:uncharacterized phage protein (TIGR02220 family)